MAYELPNNVPVALQQPRSERAVSLLLKTDHCIVDFIVGVQNAVVHHAKSARELRRVLFPLGIGELDIKQPVSISCARDCGYLCLIAFEGGEGVAPKFKASFEGTSECITRSLPEDHSQADLVGVFLYEADHMTTE